MSTSNVTNTHYLHRSKALASYQAARVLLHQEGMEYPAYVMLKEGVRATLAYVCESAYDKVYEEKSRLKNLLEAVPEGVLEPEWKEGFEYLLTLEQKGLSAIMSEDIAKLKEIKRYLKRLCNSVFGNDNIDL